MNTTSLCEASMQPECTTLSLGMNTSSSSKPQPLPFRSEDLGSGCKKLHSRGHHSGDGRHFYYSPVHFLSSCKIIAVPEKHDLAVLTMGTVHPVIPAPPDTPFYSCLIEPHWPGKTTTHPSFCKTTAFISLCLD